MGEARARLLADAIGEVTGDGVEPVSVENCGGGCIHRAEIVSVEGGRSFFVKSSPDAQQIFAAEAAGLEALAATEALRLPRVLGQAHLGNREACLVLEAIHPAREKHADFWREFGAGLAKMHQGAQHDVGSGGRFGFQHNNYLGASHQINAWTQQWPSFFAEHRLKYQMDLAHRNGVATKELLQLVERVIERIEKLIGVPPEPAALVHGDLWSGNFLHDEDGLPVVFDPAVYYGHREAELAMPLLFGGFHDDFFAAYHDIWPLESGWRQRVEIYKLYHLLNHLNLFGSGYLDGCLAIVRQFA